MQKSKSEPSNRFGSAFILVNESKRRESTGVIKRASSCVSQSSKLTTHSYSKVKLRRSFFLNETTNKDIRIYGDRLAAMKSPIYWVMLT